MNKYLIAALILTQTAFAGESSLTVTYQPLDGLSSGSIHIAQVTCHDWNSHSGGATQIELISAPNVPPTNGPKKEMTDLNLASICGVHFVASDIGDPEAPLELTLNATKLAIPPSLIDRREEIIRASLECLRRSLPDKLLKTPVTLQTEAAGGDWLKKIISEFNTHDRTKVFFTPPQS